MELVEHRSQLDLYREILHANQDVVRLSVDVPAPGRMSLEAASTLFSATRDLILAAACSAHTRRPYFPNRKPLRALEYIRKVRLAAPEAGSFAVVLESPVAPALSTAPALPEPAAEPFERAAIMMLATAGARVRQSVGETIATGSLDSFADAVQAGVNANYCDALVRLLEEDDGRNVVLSFSWAPSRPIQGAAPSRLAFSRTDAEILRAAARYLKERAPMVGFELSGVVTRLQSAAPTVGGEVTIAGLVDGGIRQVFVSLAGDDYQRAVQAHHQELEVSVEGELVREGRSYRLGNPRMFAIVE
ncbi:MAG TPA: hypothetical protein VNO30_43825 [Kofleriaceae bacterium]|nr:hypothetical protein [Kofleriaceae bacterium]